MEPHGPAVADEQQNPFSKEDLRSFDADDVEAGAAIGKMLSLFFLYTVIVMTISTVATWWWVSSPNGQ